jgi:hypothetical protein
VRNEWRGGVEPPRAPRAASDGLRDAGRPGPGCVRRDWLEPRAFALVAAFRAVTQKPSKPGVWRRKEGGFLVRGTSRRFPHRKDQGSPIQRGGDRRNRGLHAAAERAQEGPHGRGKCADDDADLQRIRHVALRGQGEGGRHPVGLRPGKVGTDAVHHLLPAFGSLLLDQIRHADIAKWRVRMAEKIHDGTYSPHTVNTWLQVLRVILKAAVVNLGCWRGRGKAPAYASRLIWWLAHGARGPRRCTTSSRPTNRRRRYVHGVVGDRFHRDEASPAGLRPSSRRCLAARPRS